jgi:hypothetical protein
MFYAKPHVAFRALAVRGDWILDGYHGPIASRTRELLLDIADLFEHRIQSGGNIYGPSDTGPRPEPPKPTPVPVPSPSPAPAPHDDWAYPVSAPIDPVGWPSKIGVHVRP